jgi:hypothetical protein
MSAKSRRDGGFGRLQRIFTKCCDFAWRDIHAALGDIAVET